MVFRLETDTVFDYLIQQGVWSLADTSIKIEPKFGKNFNLLVRLSPEAKQVPPESFLIKQEPFDSEESSRTKLHEEWNIYRVLRAHSELYPLQGLLSDAVQFDTCNGILIYRFLERYCDLDEFYAQAQQFPRTIAIALGATLAAIHQATFQRQDYRTQFDPASTHLEPDEDEVPDFRDTLEHLTPDIFHRVSVDGLKFYELYQRYDSLGQAIAHLEEDYEPCCLIHNDLKFNNILLHHDWTDWALPSLPATVAALQLPDQQGVLRLIDWEKGMWGDPALDVGAIVAEYLKVWLKSLILSRDIDMEVALRLAAVPLDTLQPTLTAFLQSYISQFPQILDTFSNFTERVLRFTGLALIESIQARLHYREPFGNVEICMMQVAKSLLCNPKAAIATVFGQASIQPAPFNPAEIQEVFIPRTPDSQADGLMSDVPLPRWVEHYSLDHVLTDLVKNIHIDCTTVAHPAYAPLELAYNAGDRYQHLPSELRQTYLVRQVRNYVYDIYFSGEQEQRLTHGNITRPPLQSTGLKNNAVAGLDIDFYRQIQNANAGTGYDDADWIVTQMENPSTAGTPSSRIQISKNGLHLWADPASELKYEDPPELGSPVLLRMPNAQLIGDCYMAVSNGGEPSAEQSGVELYFNVTPEGAIALMAALTQALNPRAYPFTFKILTNPAEYRRYDAAVLSIERICYAYVRSLLQQVYPQVRSHLRDPIPVFTKRLAPGIGLAEEPEGEHEFGLSRCELIAHALLASPDPASRLEGLRQQFAQRHLDWQYPHLSSDSEDLYPPLDTDVSYRTA